MVVMVWCGVLWCDILWCGVVWCGVVFCVIKAADSPVVDSNLFAVAAGW